MNRIVAGHPKRQIHLDSGRPVARRCLFHFRRQLRAHIDSFIDAYNKRAKPFAWTKSEVHQKRLKARFAHQ